MVYFVWLEGSGTMGMKVPIQENAVYSREEVAELLGVSLSTIKRLVQTGQLEVSKPNGIRRVFIRGSSVLRMLEQTRLEYAQ
jgi:excisionase family DNA binding protein